MEPVGCSNALGCGTGQVTVVINYPPEAGFYLASVAAGYRIAANTITLHPLTLLREEKGPDEST